MISQDNKQAMRNPWVLGWLGLLVIVLLVNIVFIVTAFRTNPGLVDNNYYEKGRYHDANYQKTMDAQNRLGWNITLRTPETINQGQPASYSVNVVDRVGNPLKGARVTLQAYRPSDASADINIELAPIADGVFQSHIDLPLKGIWDINIIVAQGDENLSTSRRVTVMSN